MILSGTLLIADAAITLLWQEPISAFLANRQQAELRDELSDAPPRVLARRPLPGDAIGRISMPTIGRSYIVVQGTAGKDLRKGPGHYPDTPLPGQPGTVAVAGHRTTYLAPFRNIDKLDHGDGISLEMPYGTFRYRVEYTRIVDPTDVAVKRRVGYDRLILSACHPLYSASQRIVVFARFVGRSAPRVGPRA